MTNSEKKNVNLQNVPWYFSLTKYGKPHVATLSISDVRDNERD